MSADMWVGLLFIWVAVVWLVVGMFRVANAKPRPRPVQVIDLEAGEER